MNTTLSKAPLFPKKEVVMNNMQIFNNLEFGEIRTVIIDNEPWFIAKDISEPLGYAQVANMSKLIDKEDKQVISSSILDEQVGDYKQAYQITIINESGLYAAIFSSKQENAKRFKHWVTSEVLPSIHKTGSYNMPTTPQGQIQLLAQGIVEMQEQINTVSDNVQAVRSDFDTFKEDCPLFPVDMDRISQTARKKGVEVMGGKSSMAYHDRSIVQMVYRDIYGELHRNFGCRSYKEIARKNIDKAVDVIESYTLPMFLMEKVDKANAMI